MVADELETNQIDKATWTRALAEANGDERKTKAKYIKLRVDQLSASTLRANGTDGPTHVDDPQRGSDASSSLPSDKPNQSRKFFGGIYHPWRRWFARWIDFVAFSLIGGALIGWVAGFSVTHAQAAGGKVPYLSHFVASRPVNTATTASPEEAKFWSAINDPLTGIPNYPAINAMPEFQKWVKMPDPISEVVRNDIVIRSYQALKPAPIIALYRQFLNQLPQPLQYNPSPGHELDATGNAQALADFNDPWGALVAKNTAQALQATQRAGQPLQYGMQPQGIAPAPAPAPGHELDATRFSFDPDKNASLSPNLSDLPNDLMLGIPVEMWLTVIFILAWIPIEGMLLSTWGTTPGKWIFGITVTDKAGYKFVPGKAMARSLRVAVEGLGIGVIYPVTCLLAYRRLTRTGSTLWDDAVGSMVLHENWTMLRIIMAVGSLITLLLILSIINH